MAERRYLYLHWEDGEHRLHEHAFYYKEGGERFNADLISGHYDGFSTISPILWHVPGFVESTDDDKASSAASQLVAASEVSSSLNWASSTSLLIKQDTVELHPHFCQVDYMAPVTEEDGRICYCQPAFNLEFNSTYIVVIRNLQNSQGTMLGASASTIPIESRTRREKPRSMTTRDISLQGYIFPALESQNVALGDINLAWDFHTVSYESSTRFVNSLYDLTMNKMEDSFGASFNTDHEGALTDLATRMEGGTSSADVAKCDSDIDYTDGTHDDMALSLLPCQGALVFNGPSTLALSIPQVRDRGYGTATKATLSALRSMIRQMCPLKRLVFWCKYPVALLWDSAQSTGRWNGPRHLQ